MLTQQVHSAGNLFDRIRRAAPVLALAGVMLAAPGAAQAAGVGEGAFYVDGRLYRTVGTPTDFSHTGAPAHSYDTIYQFFGLQKNVATAAPGDRGFNGGRWMVRGLDFHGTYAAAIADSSVNLNGNSVLDSDEEVAAAIAKGYATDTGVLRMFECPVIPLPGNG